MILTAYFGIIMKNQKKDCPVCGMKLDNNHFAPASFPGIDEEICCNCDENLGLMFTNFDEKPGEDGGYIVPDNSARLEQITGRSYLENRLIYFKALLRKKTSENDPANAKFVKNLKAEIEKTTIAIKADNS
jgi:hypothetical protein